MGCPACQQEEQKVAREKGQAEQHVTCQAQQHAGNWPARSQVRVVYWQGGHRGAAKIEAP